MGHETRKGGGVNKQWGKHSIPPAILAFLQKGGQGQKTIYFCGTHFCVGHDAKNYFFFVFYFFCGQQHLVLGIKCFRKSSGFVR